MATHPILSCAVDNEPCGAFHYCEVTIVFIDNKVRRFLALLCRAPVFHTVAGSYDHKAAILCLRLYSSSRAHTPFSFPSAQARAQVGLRPRSLNVTGGETFVAHHAFPALQRGDVIGGAYPPLHACVCVFFFFFFFFFFFLVCEWALEK